MMWPLRARYCRLGKKANETAITRHRSLDRSRPQGRGRGSSPKPATGYSIDTRTLAPGDLFFAVRGERYDAHAFVPAAFEKGARAVVVARSKVTDFLELAHTHSLLIVDDPLVALQTLATAVRRHWNKRIIGVTGSAGKTTTKEAVAEVLGSRFNVLRSKGNLNNEFGMPLQLLKLEPEHEVAVIEMGMSHAGEIAALARIAHPDWGVITNVGSAHAQNFPDGVAGIARAKYELVQSLPASGVAFLNCDDPYVAQFGRDFHGRSIYFGSGPCADPRAANIEELGADGNAVSGDSRRRAGNGDPGAARPPQYMECDGGDRRWFRSGYSAGGVCRCGGPVASSR